MVTRKSPVSSALWLVMTFFCLAAIYTLLGAFFIGVIQILVYAGAIMVLFLFVIMLLNLGNDFEPDFRADVWKAVAAGTGLVMIALLARIFAGADHPGGRRRGRRARGADGAVRRGGRHRCSRCSWITPFTCRSPGCCSWWRWWVR
jgi:hypothetical protein